MDTVEVECQSSTQLDSEKREPRVGMEFDTDDQAYEFYNEYGRRKGFCVRKGPFHKTRDDLVKDRRYLCSKEGYRQPDRRREEVKNPRPETRTGCLASMTVALQSSGKYRVIKFEPAHNHEVASVSPKKSLLLRSQKKLTKARPTLAGVIHERRLAPKPTYEFLSRQACVPQNLGHLHVDLQNYLFLKRQKTMEMGITGAIIEYFKKMQLENPSSFYSMQMDANEQITNIFWADARSIADYWHFGDVVCFDTTYKTNVCGRAFASLIGVNHHNQIIVFGAALLYEDTVNSFIWLFDNFIKAMSGKKPTTFLTEESAPISKAIATFLPDTHHCFCLSHIFQNAIKHLSHILNGSSICKSDFHRCLYEYEDEEEFLKAWESLLEKHGLKDNKWLEDLFNEREKWALVYRRHMFCANMTSMQQRESFDTLLQRYLTSELDPIRFFERIERLIEHCRYNELLEDFKMLNTSPVLFAALPVLEQASRLYTPSLCQMFQEECKLAITLKVFQLECDGSMSKYKVTDRHARDHVVKIETSDNSFQCSCCKFEFTGIQCSHVLKMLIHLNMDFLDARYILKRWTKDAKKGELNDDHRSLVQGNHQAAREMRYTDLCRNMVKLAMRAAETEESFSHLTRANLKLMKEVEGILKNVSQKHGQGTDSYLSIITCSHPC
ncbi:protein FAR1-RELATED SEQUENCE 5-like isoform X2 [Aristolochia californica]|uniref:protein FAR1-RELATED SEQUENCE 5-like isoform X2 n=1 Tax=Aristolochia californica TaxID=171875 RepID=UPI0035DFAD35